MKGQVIALSEQGTRVSVRSNLIHIESPAAGTLAVPCRDVRGCILFGSIEVTSAFIRASLNQGIDVSWFTRDGRYRGRLQGPMTANSKLRLSQFRSLEDPEQKLNFVRSIITGKLSNQRTLILRAQRRRAADELAVASVTVRQAITGAATATSVMSLRGYEGAGAAAYFRGFPGLISNSDFYFAGRNRRPPKDPVNACLSFGYALLCSTVESAVLRAGLDPMLGGLHEVAHGRPSLVLDLMEEWRPVLVDSLVLGLLNRKELMLTDFEDPTTQDQVAKALLGVEEVETAEDTNLQAVYLGATGRKILIRSYLKKLRTKFVHPQKGTSMTWLQAIEFQARNAASFFAGKEPHYSPFKAR